jgi:hypothetical protein
MFNQREDKKIMNKELINKIKADFNITGCTTSDYEKLIQCKKILSIYQMELDNLRDQMITENPWTQVPTEKSIWLANYIRNNLGKTSEKIAPFSKVWIYNSNVTVLEGWNLKNYKFAIDINCSNLNNINLSIVSRNKLKKDEYEKLFQNDFAAVFNSHNIKYIKDYRYAKNYGTISKQEELNQFIEYIYELLEELNKITTQI